MDQQRIPYFCSGFVVAALLVCISMVTSSPYAVSAEERGTTTAPPLSFSVADQTPETTERTVVFSVKPYPLTNPSVGRWTLIPRDIPLFAVEDPAAPTRTVLSVTPEEKELAPKHRELFLRTEPSSLGDLRIGPHLSVDQQDGSRPAGESGAGEEQAQQPQDRHWFLHIRPYLTRDPLEAARSPVDQGDHYQNSPLNSTDRIYGLGVITNYKLAPWLHLNSSYRWNVYEPRSNAVSSSASQKGDTSHSLFFGVTVPFSPSAGEE